MEQPVAVIRSRRLIVSKVTVPPAPEVEKDGDPEEEGGGGNDGGGDDFGGAVFGSVWLGDNERGDVGREGSKGGRGRRGR